MAESRYLTSLKESIINLDFEDIVKVAKAAIAAGVDPNLAVTEGMIPGMNVVGEKFERGDYYLSELVIAGEVMKEGLNILTPYITGDTLGRSGKVVIATVEGDCHDLGKNIVVTLLRAYSFSVVDLGVDVPTDKIVGALQEHQPAVLGLSALLSLTMPKMGEIIEALKRTDLQKKVRVIVGGSPVTPEFAESIGADYRATDAIEGVKKCIEWVTP